MAVTAAELNVVFAADTSDLKKGGQEAQGILKGVAATAGGMLAAQAFTGITSGLREVVAGGVSYNMTLESTAQKLEVVLGSQQAAIEAQDKLLKMATKSPFEYTELANSATILESMGISFEKYIDGLGEAAAAMGKSPEQIAEALADAASGEFERLKELGIKATMDGQNVILSYMEDGVQKTITVAKGNTEQMLDAVNGIFLAKFDGSMQKMSETMQGQLSTLRDNWNTFLGGLTSGLFEMSKGAIEALNGFFGIFNKLREKGRNVFESLWGGIRRTLKGVLGKDNPLFQFLKNAKREVTSLVDAFREGGFAGVVSKIVGDIGKTFRKNWPKVVAWARDEAVPRVMNALGWLKDELIKRAPGWIEAGKNKLIEAWGAVISWAQTYGVPLLMKGLETLKTKLEENMPGWIEAGKTKLVETWDTISTWAMNEGIPNLMKELGKLKDELIAEAPGWMEAGKTEIQNGWDGVVAWMKTEGVQNFIDGLGELKDKLLAKLKENIPTAEDLFTFASGLGEKLGEAIDDINWATVVQKIGQGLTADIKFWLSIWGGIATLIAGLIAGTISGLAKVDWGSFITELKDGLILAIAEFATLGSEIWDQITAMITAAVPTAAELADDFKAIGASIAGAISSSIWNALPDWAQAGLGSLGGLTGIGGGGESTAGGEAAPAGQPAVSGLRFNGGGSPAPSAAAARSSGGGGTSNRTVNLTVNTQASDPNAVATAVLGRLYGAMDRVGAGVA